MNPGEVRVFEQGGKRALVLSVGLWANRKRKNGPIHIHITGTPKFHTTVTNQPSQRYHRTLFRDLRRVLLANGRWPYGQDGVETETK